MVTKTGENGRVCQNGHKNTDHQEKAGQSSEVVEKTKDVFSKSISPQAAPKQRSEREIMIEMLINDHHMLPDVAAAYYDQMLC
jgi:hypothetical protein